MDFYNLHGIRNACKRHSANISYKGYVDIPVLLDYSLYLLYILHICKVLGAVAILIPEFSIVKNKPMPVSFFAMPGAVFSHIALGTSINKIVSSLVLLIMTVVYLYFSTTHKNISENTVTEYDES